METPVSLGAVDTPPDGPGVAAVNEAVASLYGSWVRQALNQLSKAKVTGMAMAALLVICGMLIAANTSGIIRTVAGIAAFLTVVVTLAAIEVGADRLRGRQVSTN